MTDSAHDRLQASQLFDGPVDSLAVKHWPAWARAHLGGCPGCQSLLAAERQLRAAVQLLDGVDQRGLRRGPPTQAERATRLAARRPLPLGEIAPKVQPLAERVLRFAASPLELRRTSVGIRVWHPDALEILVLMTEEGGRPAVLHHRREASAGVGLDLSCRPAQGGRVLALASNRPLEPEHWLVWFRDALAADQLNELVQDNQSVFVHAAHATIPPPLRSSLLRIQPEPLPDASPGVAALLKRAAAAGRGDDAMLAASLYRQALELAFTTNDPTGQVKAGMGIALSLQGMGYGSDGVRVLRWVIQHHYLDATWATWVCHHMANGALRSLDLDAAESWVNEARTVSGTQDGWTKLVSLSVLNARGDWAGVGRVAETLVDEPLPAVQRAHISVLAATALIQQGRLAQAREVLAGIEQPEDPPLETLLHRAVADAMLASATRLGPRWDELLEGLVPTFSDKDGGLLSSWDVPPLLRLVELAHRAGDPKAAADLLRLRFFDSERARAPEQRLLGLCASFNGLQLVGPAEHSRARRLSLSPQRLRELVVQARDELRSHDDIEPCRSLAHLLFEGGDLEPGQVWVGSDGLLADAPMLAIAASIGGDARKLPAFRELVGIRRSPPTRDGRCIDIVSLADAQGNLPWAAQEVSRSEASLWLRGKAVTRSRLQLDAPCGLLHLGVHARREQGVPELLFADGPMGPLEIAQLSLPGAPVVLLAGCFTAVARAELGVERSLADAFMRAGASSVIATRWPVLDREMHRFVRALVEAWPYDDVAAQVAQVCLDLRAQRVHARCWAAPVVY